MSEKLDMSKFEDSYEVAVKALIDAKINHLPVALEEAPQKQTAKIVNLMDALRESLGAADTRSGKKPPKSERTPPAKKIALVKSPTKRKTA